MGLDLLSTVPHVQARFQQASAIAGLDLVELVRTADAAALTRTEITQITVFALSTAIAEFLMARGLEPQAVAGHSLGEFSALACAGVLEWEEAARLVWQRGLAMKAASASGAQAMAAIGGLSAEAVAALCAEAAPAGLVVVANLNSPLQLVISGEEAAVEEVMRRVRERPLTRVDRLNVGGAFHSPLMQPARDALRQAIESAVLRPPAVPVVSSIDGELVTDLEVYRKKLIDQVTAPVRWRDAVHRLRHMGVDHFLEVGPGRVLTGLVRQTDRTARTATAGSLAECELLLGQRREAGD